MHLERRLARIREVVDSRQQGAIVLEDIHDPHNAQAVFRSADAMGFQRVCLVFDREKPFDPQNLGRQSSSSAHKWLDFEVFGHIGECAASLKEEGFELLATVPDPEAESIFEAQLLRPRTALMLGNEHRGLSDAAVGLADRLLTVPMAGMVQSLNLSVTAAICLYEITRQRRLAGPEKHLLGDAAKDRLFEDLCGR